MKTLSEAMQMMGGIFLWIQILIILLILILSVQKVMSYFGRHEIKKSSFIRSHHAILFLGIIGLVWGIFTQLVGFILALNAIIEAADISPELILMGLKNSFINPVIGLGTLILAALFWAILHGHYTSALNKKSPKEKE